MRLSEDQLMKAAAKYADDNADAEGELVESVIGNDIDTQYIQYTSDMWEGGVPVTKMFNRNDEIPLFVPAGTKLVGVTYIGRASGCRLVDFYYGRAWYSTTDPEILEEFDLDY